MTEPYLFISYRRDDTKWIVRNLHRQLVEQLGSNRVFMDRVEIRGGQAWKDRINDALDKATVVVAVIGSQWLRLKGRYEQRRIDNDDDWVRREIRTALTQDKCLIPLYVDGAETITDARALPQDLHEMIGKQALNLTLDEWEEGCKKLRECIRRLGFTLFNPAIPMPTPRKRVAPLDETQLSSIKDELPLWDVLTTYDGDARRTWLYRSYDFKGFVDSTRFMAEASPAIDAGQHHPRWENMWKTVRVWFSTWDIEFEPTIYDVDAAKKLDEVYAAFMQRE